MARPVIGISCYIERVDRSPWVGQWSAVLPHGYVEHIEDAGGLAVILPPRLDADDRMAAEVLARLDGLVIAGGADVEASRYAARSHPTSQSPRPDRDSWELALTRVAIERDLPLLGICRGMQVMAVEAGGRLEQHLPERTGTEVHSPMLGAYARHPITCVAGTELGRLLGTEELSVPTYHHQAVQPSSLEGTAYRLSAWHEDGTLEGMEDPRGRFRLAVQWHPEAGEDPRLFVGLIAAAGEQGRVEACNG